MLEQTLRASQGRYVSSSAYSSGAVSLNFSAPVSDVYVIWCRVLSPANNKDSFFVSVDGGPEDIYDTAQGTWSSDWQWTVVNGRAGTNQPLTLNPRTFSLAAGNHTVVFRDREYETKLDKIIVTNDLSFVPSSAPDQIGIFRNGLWVLDSNRNRQFDGTGPGQDRAFAFGGLPGDVPVTGDWNNDGSDEVGFYRGGAWYLDWNGDDQFTGADRLYFFGGVPGDTPVVGDWNGDGADEIGIFRNGYYWILDADGNGQFNPAGDVATPYGGMAGDIPVTGDWDGDGTTEIGIFRAGFFWILDANGNYSFDGTGTGQDLAFPFGGLPGDVPLVGDWNGDRTSEVGVFRGGFFWVLDKNGNRAFDGTGPGQDEAFAFGGLPGDVPVVGAW